MNAAGIAFCFFVMADRAVNLLIEFKMRNVFEIGRLGMAIPAGERSVHALAEKRRRNENRLPGRTGKRGVLVAVQTLLVGERRPGARCRNQ